MSNICSIICGAPCGVFRKELVEGFVIAADRGLDHCLKNGITPDLAAGDFDSAAAELPDGIECVRVSPIKDNTDAALAANIAIERGFTQLRFLCALGGRIDHTMANIQLLYSLKKRGIKAALFGDSSEIFLLENESVKFAKYDGYLSVFSYGEFAEISAFGVKYPVEKRVFTNDFPLGVSNEITAPFAEITVHSGTAIIIKEYN